MDIILHIIILLLLIVLIYQDFTERSVHWFLFPLLIISQFTLTYLSIGWDDLLLNATVILALLALQFLLLSLYFSFRNGRLINIINKYIGIGDLFYFLFLCLAFSPFNFISFFVGSLLLILTTYFLLIRTKTKQYKIPLLGSLSIAYIVLLAVQQISCFNQFDDALMVHLFL